MKMSIRSGCEAKGLRKNFMLKKFLPAETSQEETCDQCLREMNWQSYFGFIMVNPPEVGNTSKCPHDCVPCDLSS